MPVEIKEHPRREKEAKSKPREKIITMRVSDEEYRQLKEKTERYKTTITNLLRPGLQEKIKQEKRLYSLYKCEGCKKRILKNEEYYCETVNKEKQTQGAHEIEIDILDSEPTKILCMDCARKKHKLAWLKTPSRQSQQVKESERTSKSP